LPSLLFFLGAILLRQPVSLLVHQADSFFTRLPPFPDRRDPPLERDALLAPVSSCYCHAVSTGFRFPFSCCFHTDAPLRMPKTTSSSLRSFFFVPPPLFLPSNPSSDYFEKRVFVRPALARPSVFVVSPSALLLSLFAPLN